MFFRRTPRESPSELANRLNRQGKVDQIEHELQRYETARLNAKDREDFHHLWGISAFQRGDRTEALRRFKDGLREFPNSQNLLFSLGQEHEELKEIDEMLACFDRCSFPNIGSHFVMAMVRYAYLWNRPERGTEYLKPVLEAYFRLGIADDHFVYVRGLPFFSQTWSYLVAFAWLQKNFGVTDAYLVRAKAGLSDYQFDHLEQFYICLKSGDYSVEVDRAKKELAKWDSRFPSGYRRTQLACLQANSARDSSQAIDYLAAVDLGGSDFPWLADVLLIQRARAFWVGGNQIEEKPLRDAFMKRQKLLFEPDHAVNFSFLDYQETLKPIYHGRPA